MTYELGVLIAFIIITVGNTLYYLHAGKDDSLIDNVALIFFTTLIGTALSWLTLLALLVVGTTLLLYNKFKGTK